MFVKDSLVKVHGKVYTVLSVHGKGKTLKVTDGVKDFFKKTCDCKPVTA